MEKKYILIFNLLLFLFFSLSIQSSLASYQGIVIYTPYTSQSVSPGESLSYDVEIINQSDQIETVSIKVLGVPDSWDPKLTAGNTIIDEISVKPESFGSDFSKTVKLDLSIPLEINRGRYDLEILAETNSGLQRVLPLHVQVIEQGVFETDMEVTQANMEGYADSEFNYNITLNNRTAATQNYSLVASAPTGWGVRFRVRGNYATSVQLEPGDSETLTVNVKSPMRAEAGSYTIDIRAVSGSATAEASLETVIQGEYDLDLVTPSGRLSADVTAGQSTTIPLLLRNTGTIPLEDISLRASAPAEWSVEFDVEENRVSRLDAGEELPINAVVSSSNKAIAGDYRLNIDANASEASANANFRITVRRSVATGATGLTFIVLVAGGIFYLVKKFGRR